MEAIQSHVHQPLHRRKTFAKIGVARFAQCLLPHQPDRVDRAAVPNRLVIILALGKRIHSAHEETLAVLCMHHRAFAQQVERSNDGVLRVAVQTRVLTQRRELVTRLENTGQDLATDVRCDFLSQ